MWQKESWFHNSEVKENVRNDVCHVFILGSLSKEGDDAQGRIVQSPIKLTQD